MTGTLMNWLTFFLAASLKGSVILLIALLVSWRMHRFSAATRHAVIAVALGAFLVLPLAQLVTPRWSVAALPRPVTEFVQTAPGASAAPAPAATVTTELSVEETRIVRGPVTGTESGPARASTAVHSPVEAEASPPIPWARILLLVWLAGVSLVMLRLVVGLAGVWLLERRATMITDGGWLQTAHALAQRLGLTRGVTLLRGDRGTVPLTWGVLQPVVWLPAGSGTWDDERRAVVLAHELAHVKRRDAVTQWIANITLALHWFNPLAWLAARQLRTERERACDEAVLLLGTQPTVYAEHLLAMVRSLGEQGGPAAAMAMARRSQFEGRLLAILDAASGRGRGGSVRLAVVMTIAMLITIPLAALAPAAPAAAADVPGLASEAGGYPAALSAADEAEFDRRIDDAFDSALDARDDASSAPLGRHGPGGVPRVTLPAAGAEARDAASAVLRDAAAAEQVLNRAATSGDSALLLEIIAATTQMSSSSDRALVLIRVAELRALEPSVLRAIAAAAKPIPSSGSRASVLVALLKHHPSVLSVARDAFFEAAESIGSSSARSSVLLPAASIPQRDPEVVTAMAWATASMPSSSERTHVLNAMFRHQVHALGSAAPVVFAVLDSIPSSTDRSQLLHQILATNPALSDAALVHVIRSGSRIGSPTDRAQLLIAVARRGSLTGSVRTAFMEAVNSIESSSSRAAVLAALVGDAAEAKSVAPPASPGEASAGRPSSGGSRDRQWYVRRDTTDGMARETVLMWQGVELRDGEIVFASSRGRVEYEEKREPIDGRGAPELHKIIVTMQGGRVLYDYCINEVTQTFSGDAPARLTAMIRRAERGQR